jgi:hypothetical protein
MRENLPFDDFVKQQFKGYSPDVPGHIWENIVAERRSRPKGFWVTMLSGRNLFLLTIVMIVGAGGSYYLLSPKSGTLSAQNSPIQKDPVADQKLHLSQKADVAENKQPLPTEQSDNKSSNGNTIIPARPATSETSSNHNQLVSSSTHANRTKNADVVTADEGESNKETESLTMREIYLPKSWEIKQM